MSMNSEQLAVLANDITTSTDQGVQDALAAEDYAELANLYNQESTEYVWKPELSVDEYTSAIDWAEHQTIGELNRESWNVMTGFATLPLRLELTSVQVGMNMVWSGVGNVTKNALAAIGIPLLTKAELLYVTGEGSGNLGDPYYYGWQGTLTEQDVATALTDSQDSNVVALSSKKNRDQNIIVTVPTDLPAQGAISYLIRNQFDGVWTEWAGSTLSGLNTVLAAGVYSGRLAGSYIKSATAEIKVVCPYGVLVELSVEGA